MCQPRDGSKHQNLVGGNGGRREFGHSAAPGNIHPDASDRSSCPATPSDNASRVATLTAVQDSLGWSSSTSPDGAAVNSGVDAKICLPFNQDNSTGHKQKVTMDSCRPDDQTYLLALTFLPADLPVTFSSFCSAAWYLRRASAMSTWVGGSFSPISSIVSAIICDTARLRNHL